MFSLWHISRTKSNGTIFYTAILGERWKKRQSKEEQEFQIKKMIRERSVKFFRI
jgi:hypothetical protein